MKWIQSSTWTAHWHVCFPFFFRLLAGTTETSSAQQHLWGEQIHYNNWYNNKEKDHLSIACFYQVAGNKKCCGNTSQQTSVSTAFLSSLKLIDKNNTCAQSMTFILTACLIQTTAETNTFTWNFEQGSNFIIWCWSKIEAFGGKRALQIFG